MSRKRALGRFDPLVDKLDESIGTEASRCLCCSTRMDEGVLCEGCWKRLICPECGHCSDHCTCERKPACPTCS